MYKVLVTCSGIGNRLGDLTKYTNKSLVRVGSKPAISYILDSYPDDIEIVVTLGYYGDHVKEFLTIAYPNRKFTFVDVDKFVGHGSSLLYSMLCAKDSLMCPFIFHACDTIIQNNKIPEPDKNWLGGHKKSDSTQYRTFNINYEKSTVSKINDKGEFSYDYDYLGVCGIKDYDKFWDIAEKVYNLNSDDSSLSDCHISSNMISEGIEFSYKIFDNWLDIGNTVSLQKARSNISDDIHFEVLDKLDESIFVIDNHVIKFFSDEGVVKNRVSRVKYLNNTTPTITDYSKHYYKYKFVDGNLFADKVTLCSFNKFLHWAKNNLWVKNVTDNVFVNNCYDFYYTKTIKRIKQYLLKKNIEDNGQFINGIHIPGIFELLDMVDFNWLATTEATGFHGDFILDNVIEKSDGFCLIDWRQDFGGMIDRGDMHYDLAKLNHNLTVNHEIINKGLYKIEADGNNITCDILRKNMLVKCEDVLKSFMADNKIDSYKINILTSIIWLNMAPLHSSPFDTFLFYFGKYSLFNIIKGNTWKNH